MEDELYQAQDNVRNPQSEVSNRESFHSNHTQLNEITPDRRREIKKTIKWQKFLEQ